MEADPDAGPSAGRRFGCGFRLMNIRQMASNSLVLGKLRLKRSAGRLVWRTNFHS